MTYLKDMSCFKYCKLTTNNQQPTTNNQQLTTNMKGLSFKAVIFDLDGVITKTALVHSAAWKTMFDDYLKERETKYNEPFREFSHQEDYLTYVNGKPRYKGVESFLKSRNIHLEHGSPHDAPDTETICGLGNKKTNCSMK